MLAFVALAALLGGSATEPISYNTLRTQFVAPPSWARPHTWWHWMGGNVSKEGITADLESMKEAGIGGAHIFDAGQGIPAGPVDYNSPQWRELMAYAMAEAQRLGLDMTMHNCSGWSSSGGPWVKPEDAMKKVVWSETRVNATKAETVEVQLNKPQIIGGYYKEIGLWVFPTPQSGEKNDVASFVGLSGNPGSDASLKWPQIDNARLLALQVKIDSDGKVKVNLNKGNWTILRLGSTLTGARNVASRPTGEGLEVDKLSDESLDRFLEGGLMPLFKEIGDPVGKAFSTVLIDSYETGFQNWTPELLKEFKRLRGYSADPYLPALAGYVVKDNETTLRFLYDYRRTIADLWAENYSGHFASRLQEKGLKLAIEPYGNGSFDPFTYAKSAGLIMGEYWTGDANLNGSVKQAASVAHVYGHSVVGAESLTAVPSRAGWRNQPRQWKPFADEAYATGISRVIYHRFAHQPWANGVLPGMTMGPWGSHVDRTETFWSYMADWDGYLSRCQYLLQSGVFCADICLFTGEGSPQQYTGEGYQLPEVPKGYDYDFCGSDPLMSLRVLNGLLLLPNGATYRVLALPNTTQMTVELAQKIKKLVESGATVVGPRPVKSPSLADGKKGDGIVAQIGSELWGATPSGSKVFGKGRVYWGVDLAKVLRQQGIGPDFSSNESKLHIIHRRLDETDIFFVASSRKSAETVECRFRIYGRVPEVWNPQTGKISDASVWRSTRWGTEVEVPLDVDGSTFVVFRRPLMGVNHLVQVDAKLAKDVDSARKPLRIVSAQYGKLDDKAMMIDVTDLLQKEIRDASLSLVVSNDTMGGDPAYQVVKQLQVVYQYGEERKTLTVDENQELALGDVPDANAAFPYEVVPSEKGVTFNVWEDGRYMIRWATNVTAQVASTKLDEPIKVDGKWNVRFPAGWDAPESTVFDKLISWTDHTIFGIKYFSGTATYSKKINVPSEWLAKGSKVYLDLGDVRELARVRLNGKLVGTFWKPPFRVDITSYAKTGANDLEVDVTNLWVNRLIGDEQFPDDMGWDGDHLKGWPEWFVKGLPRPEPRRKTFTTWRHNFKDTPLLPSGLIGPVLLKQVKTYEFVKPPMNGMGF
jgi:hypothetical protein